MVLGFVIEEWRQWVASGVAVKGFRGSRWGFWSEMGFVGQWWRIESGIIESKNNNTVTNCFFIGHNSYAREFFKFVRKIVDRYSVFLILLYPLFSWKWINGEGVVVTSLGEIIIILENIYSFLTFFFIF